MKGWREHKRSDFIKVKQNQGSVELHIVKETIYLDKTHFLKIQHPIIKFKSR
jgi:hypothetical protein